MPKLNLSVFLNSYNDKCQTSTPALSNFRWNREINGIPYTVENSQMIQVAPNATVNILTSDNKSFVYLDTDAALSVIYNGGSPMTLNPISVNGKIQAGIFFISGPVTSLSVTNNGSVAANVFFASME